MLLSFINWDFSVPTLKCIFHKIQGHKRFTRTLFIRTKHNMQMRWRAKTLVCGWAVLFLCPQLGVKKMTQNFFLVGGSGVCVCVCVCVASPCFPHFVPLPSCPPLLLCHTGTYTQTGAYSYTVLFTVCCLDLNGPHCPSSTPHPPSALWTFKLME